MAKSESIAELAGALAKFQGEVTNPANTATNPFFQSKYAPLNDVLNVVRPILSKHGLSVVQAPSGDGERVMVTTTLLHSSGEYIEFPQLVLKADKATAQGAGSAITYARRYALSAILGISSEDDDDGNNAELGKVSSQDNKVKRPVSNATKQEESISDAQRKLIYKLVKDKNYDEELLISYVNKKFNKESSKDLTKKEASEVITMLNEFKK